MGVGRCTGEFYTNDGMILSREPEWIQGAINFLIGIVRRVVLMANVEKSETTTCQIGEIQTSMS